MDTMKHRRLQELKRSDFEIAEGEPDIRGWDVRDSLGHKLGEVDELIVDAQEKKIRYMIVDLDNEGLDLDHRNVLIPIGLAQLDEKADDVLLPSVQVEQLRSLPEYEKDHLDPQAEKRICEVLGRNTQGTSYAEGLDPEPEFYKHDYFNDDNLYRHRMREKKHQESDYEKGLRLWEKRSSGGIIEDSETRRNRAESYRRQEEEQAVPVSRKRGRPRKNEDRNLGSQSDTSREEYHRRDESVEDRIRREGLRDPDDVY